MRYYSQHLSQWKTLENSRRSMYLPSSSAIHFLLLSLRPILVPIRHFDGVVISNVRRIQQELKPTKYQSPLVYELDFKPRETSSS